MSGGLFQRLVAQARGTGHTVRTRASLPYEGQSGPAPADAAHGFPAHDDGPSTQASRVDTLAPESPAAPATGPEQADDATDDTPAPLITPAAARARVTKASKGSSSAAPKTAPAPPRPASMAALTHADRADVDETRSIDAPVLPTLPSAPEAVGSAPTERRGNAPPTDPLPTPLLSPDNPMPASPAGSQGAATDIAPDEHRRERRDRSQVATEVATPPEVHVHIGRIEIARPPPPAPAPASGKRREATLTLDAYLARRERGQR